MDRSFQLGSAAVIAMLCAVQCGLFAEESGTSVLEVPEVIVATQAEPLIAGPFKPAWDSLQQYEVPEWFENAKFGIWAHWGPQCQPEAGDWYARMMYYPGSRQYESHLKTYGHPSEFGFKDVIHAWKADQWDPDKLVALYKKVGARYFFAMGNHHDNLDLWDSKYHRWNSVAVGPQKDILAGWAKAAKQQGLPFGISLHASHAWSWYEPSRGSDASGPKAGVPYDGTLTVADGEGTWWQGLDPQELYAQHHAHSEGWQDPRGLHAQWNWGNGVSRPDQAYCEAFYNRTMDAIHQYDPDLVYFDDTAVPLWPVSDAGLKIVSNFYNLKIAEGKTGVVFGKILDEDQRKALVWDIERGVASDILPFHWQTDTCIGQWHYNREVYDNRSYKTAKTVIQMLVDIVSKNGNLLLNIPVRGDGSIDDQELSVLEGIGAWMEVNSEAIYDTRPWEVFGEGPASGGAALQAQGFNEGKGKPLTHEDIRFTQKGEVLYAFIMENDASVDIRITSLSRGNPLLHNRKVLSLEQLGCPQTPHWEQTENGLIIRLSGEGVQVVKIQGLL